MANFVYICILKQIGDKIMSDFSIQKVKHSIMIPSHRIDEEIAVLEKMIDKFQVNNPIDDSCESSKQETFEEELLGFAK